MGHGKAQRTERLCRKIPAHSVLEPWHWTQTLTDSRHITCPQESKSSCVTLITRLRNMGKTMQKWKAYRIYKRPTPPPPPPPKSNKLMFLNQYAAKRRTVLSQKIRKCATPSSIQTHTTLHRTKGEPKVKRLKWLTCNFVRCQLRVIGLAVGKERWLSGVLFRGLPLRISLVSGGFQCLRWAK